MNISITLLLIIVTCITSFIAFSNRDLLNKLIFYPPAVSERKEWYRLFTCGFIHADIGHLVFNMYALYIFGEGHQHNGLEYAFLEIFGPSGKLLFLLMYVLALAASLLPTYQKHRTNYHYRSLGASGAVSAVVFASIALNPLGYMGLIFIPVYLVAFLFGALYLAVTYYLDKRGDGNINHSAHLWGALFGVAFLLITAQVLADYPVLSVLIEQIKTFEPSKIIRVG